MNSDPSQPASTPSPSSSATPRTSNLKGRWKRASGPGVPAPRPTAASPASFGEVADVTSARENLSGQHVRGYESSKPAPAAPVATPPPAPPAVARPAAPVSIPAPKPLPVAAPTAARGLATPYPDTDLPPVPDTHPASSRPEPRLQPETPRMVSSLPTPKIWKPTPRPETSAVCCRAGPRSSGTARAPAPRDFPREPRRDSGRDTPPPRTAAAASRPFEVPRDPRLEPLPPRKRRCPALPGKYCFRPQRFARFFPGPPPASRAIRGTFPSNPVASSVIRVIARTAPARIRARIIATAVRSLAASNPPPLAPARDGRGRGDRENYVALKPDPANDPAPRRLRTEATKPIPVENHTPSAFSPKSAGQIHSRQAQSRAFPPRARAEKRESRTRSAPTPPFPRTSRNLKTNPWRRKRNPAASSA